MSEALERILATDPSDVGCEEAMAILHVYVELVADDPATARATYPGMVAHLAQCGPCHEDFAGLTATLRLA